MKRLFLVLGGATCLLTQATAQQQQRKCGADIVHKQLIAQDPAWEQRLIDQRNSLEQEARDYIEQQANGGAAKTTAVSAIPVVFHIVVNSSQLAGLGGATGVAKRVDSQIAVLERDFNKNNYDSTLIPTSWKPLFGNTGIHFGKARLDPNGHCTPGYEIKTITGTGFSNYTNSFPEAKTSTTGLAAWDVTKYLNVWVINFEGDAASLLGITMPKSYTTSFTVNEQGICILYNTLGTQTTGAGTFPSTYNKGRTLTHEMGHFFELWHTWGDDGPTGLPSYPGYCPWANGCSTSGTGHDDGISDTPPEKEAVYGNPAYTITGGTLNDCCKLNATSTNVQPIGIPCLDYMDYTDDAAMHLFTPLQAAAAASKVLNTTSTYYTLTQHPNLLTCPVSVTETELNTGISIYPNPTVGEVNISLSAGQDELTNIEVYNIMGQQVLNVKGANKDYYSLNLGNMSKGMYLLRCNFASGSVTRKVMLQ